MQMSSIISPIQIKLDRQSTVVEIAMNLESEEQESTLSVHLLATIFNSL